MRDSGLKEFQLFYYQTFIASTVRQAEKNEDLLDIV